MTKKTVKESTFLLSSLVLSVILGCYYSVSFYYLNLFQFSPSDSLFHYLFYALLVCGIGAISFHLFTQKRSTVPRTNEDWASVGLTLLIIWINISLFIWVYNGIMGLVVFDLSNLGRLAAYVLLIGILPFLFFLLFIQRQLLNFGIPPPSSQTTLSSPAEIQLILKADGGKKSIKISPKDFIMAEAADNYCYVWYVKNEEPRKEILRTTMKKLEKDITDHPDIFRLHRSFIVNKTKINEVTGNSQAWKLQLRHIDSLIPVSRNFDLELLK